MAGDEDSTPHHSHHHHHHHTNDTAHHHHHDHEHASEHHHAHHHGRVCCGHVHVYSLILRALLVLAIAVSWVGSTQFSRSTYSSTFNAPLFNVWFSTSWLVLSIVALLVPYSRRTPATASDNPQHTSTSTSTISTGSDTVKAGAVSVQFLQSQSRLPPGFIRIWLGHAPAVQLTPASGYGSAPPVSEPHISRMCCFRLVLPFCLLWVLANYLYVKALGLITATDVTAVFSATPAVVYILSLLLLHERLALLKVLAVALAIGGVLLIALAQHVNGVSAGGVLLTLGASVCAATYKVFFKVTLGDAGLHTVVALLAALAAINIVLVWPFWLILQETDAEPFEWAVVPWSYLCGSAALALAFNFLVNFGVAYTFPLFVSLGTVVGIPLNAAADAVFHGITIGPMQIAGCCLVWLSFIVMLIPTKS
ncbi:hypothetical protein PTSG_01400 [Salpingoeca rosetta]|uniref:EamA domain-containing protein n=1 Tax=Salpingoeca rosetta (strain ATCC 50818 / BSB-021) TaxID=946362 RepID=F2U086_SALR5|nr:uncharacterized protein PTSG_01400 [Salpingoeca rosetta]EGD80814.1 hypothetical protein PTSG_01400 [Salpingoeca rosetta]|eukprot:XP_004997375.1 hypothetical protein PTSG_01400 [Salpingoeca rosetta]